MDKTIFDSVCLCFRGNIQAAAIPANDDLTTPSMVTPSGSKKKHKKQEEVVSWTDWFGVFVWHCDHYCGTLLYQLPP